MNRSLELKARRSWIWWSLRGSFLAMTIVGIVLGYGMVWIRERRMVAARQVALLQRMPVPLRDVELYREAPQSQPCKVFVLNFLGEPSRQMILIVLTHQPASGDVTDSAKEELRQTSQLFPEAIVAFVRAPRSSSGHGGD